MTRTQQGKTQGTTRNKQNYEGTTRNKQDYEGTTRNKQDYEGTTRNKQNYEGTTRNNKTTRARPASQALEQSTQCQGGVHTPVGKLDPTLEMTAIPRRPQNGAVGELDTTLEMTAIPRRPQNGAVGELSAFHATIASSRVR